MMPGPGDTVFANNPFDDAGPGGMGPMAGPGTQTFLALN